MAGRSDRLKPRLPHARLAVLAAAVLLAHLLGLETLARRHAASSLLQPVVDPMFTRVLEQAEPPPAPPAVAQADVPTPATRRPTITGLSLDAGQAQPEPEPPPPPAAVRPPPARVEPPAQPTPEPAPATATAPADTARTVDAAAVPPPPAAPVPDNPPAAVEPATAAPAPTPAAAPSPAAASSGTGSEAGPNLDTWPRDSRLRYALSGQFRGGPLYGAAQVQWQRTGEHYQVRVQIDISLAGSRVLTSQGEVTPGGLVPRIYEEARGARVRGLRLQDRELLLSDGRSLPRPQGVQDTASQFIELGHRFATGREALEAGRTIQVWLARPGGVDLWTYDVAPRELLRLPRYGEVEALRLSPRPIADPRGNITAEMWFAPRLQYLPVRIRVSMGEEATVDLLVDSIEQR